MPRPKFQKRQRRPPHPLMVFFKRLREEQGWSQTDVADAVKPTVTQSMISDLEAGVTQQPRLETIARLAEAFEHSIEVQVFDKDGELVFLWSRELCAQDNTNGDAS